MDGRNRCLKIYYFLPLNYRSAPRSKSSVSSVDDLFSFCCCRCPNEMQTGRQNAHVCSSECTSPHGDVLMASIDLRNARNYPGNHSTVLKTPTQKPERLERNVIDGSDNSRRAKMYLISPALSTAHPSLWPRRFVPPWLPADRRCPPG